MPKEQLNVRVSGLTRRQLDELGRRWGTTQTETLTVIIDRMYQQEITMSTRVAFGVITNDNAELVRPIDQRREAENARDWQYGEWFVYEGDQWQHKGYYLWVPEAKRIGICTNGDSQWANADGVQGALEMYVDNPDAYEASN